jgi:Amt family ammonium transporter
VVTLPGPDAKVLVYNPGDIAWTLTSFALVWFMIPGVGFFYSGLLRRKNALSMIHMSVMIAAVVSFQWFLVGFSLVYSDTGGPFIGDLRYFGLKNVLGQASEPTKKLPSIVFCIYQLTFAVFTPGIALGAVAERGRMGPIMVFAFVWATLVYDPIAHWLWNDNGWSARLGGIDFAGGTPVHVASGTTALAISWYLKPRLGYGSERLAYKPNNTSYVYLGTVMMWFGWFGFNGGSALGANLRAAQACIVTNMAASVGGLTWMLWDWRLEHKWSAVGFCSGAIAGLVAITPGAGYVGAPASVAFGVAAGTICNFATQLKFWFGIDDTLDIFAAHAVGGVVGNLLTGIFAQRSVAKFDGYTVIRGGWLDGHYMQLVYQLADSAAGLVYSFVGTTIILWVMHYIPGLRIRVKEEAEIFGIDDAEMGETAYDYVTLEAEINPMQGCPEMSRVPSISSGM